MPTVYFTDNCCTLMPLATLVNLDFESYALKFVRATEMAAISAYKTIGLGDPILSDRVAVEAARSTLNSINMKGLIRIGEGERDNAPMLYVGEELGLSHSSMVEIDIAIDPLECTTSCALAKSDSMTSLAFGSRGCFRSMPDIYMEKIAVRIPVQNNEISIERPIAENLNTLSKLTGRSIESLRVVVLNRPRHEELIASIRRAGARVVIIEDGDIWGVVSVALGANDMYIGIGGAPEGVLAAAALKCMSCFMQTRFIINNDSDRAKLINLGIDNTASVYGIDDLVNSDVCFVATGVTDGSFLSGVSAQENGAVYTCNSVAMFSNGIGTIMIERSFAIT